MRTDIDWAAHMEAVARRLCGEPNKHLSKPGELRFGSHGSLRVTIAGPHRGTWHDFEPPEAGGGVLDLIRHKRGLSNGEAVDWIKSEFHLDIEEPRVQQPQRASARIVATYDYKNEHGNLLFQVCRMDPKTFRQRRPHPEGGWVWDVKGVQQVPYRLPEWVRAVERGILIVEGEKDADLLSKNGFMATTNAGGAGKWREEFAQYFRGRNVVILPDNDDPGRSHADDIIRSLLPVAAEVKVINLPDLIEKGDVSDWFAAGGTRDELLSIIETAEPVRKAPEPAANVVHGKFGKERGASSDGDGPDDDLPGAQGSFVQNDIGNALALVEKYGRALRYALGLGWHVWDGKRYAIDHENVKAQRLAHDISSDLIEAALQESDKDKRAKKIKWAISSGNSSRISGMLTQAKSYLDLTSDDFDRDPMLLNCQNGTVDLRTGELRPHRQEDLLTKICGTDYDPRATCPRFERFMLEIFDEDREMVSFVQRSTGYSLTGMTNEQVVYIMHGGGSNGKSVLLETIHAIISDYFKSSPAEAWIAKERSGPTNDMAALAGARFASVVETEHGKHLAESMVKQVTGGDAVTARFMYKENFTFIPKFKLWLATNHKPKIRGSEFAIWRRIILLPFVVTFNDKDKLIPGQKEKDPGLKDKLIEEYPGILAWMVRGCLEWQKVGLRPPETVLHATESYQDSQDNVSAFIRDNCWLQRSLQCPVGQLYAAYENWCEENDEEALSSRAFGKNLDDRGLPPGPRDKHARKRKGIDLKEEFRAAAIARQGATKP
jgi:putative DNA primase/helicase